MKRCNWLLALAFLVFPVSTSMGLGLIIIEDSRYWPGPEPIPPQPRPFPQPHHFPTSAYRFAPLEIQQVEVHTRIRDQIATTSVEEEFFNPSSQRLEGSFIFPVPKGAHLDKFSMEVDGKNVTAELLSADKARSIYEDIVRKLEDPGLLEYAGRDLFKVRIFPIESGSHKRVKLSYTEILVSDGGLLSYHLPLNTEKFSARPLKSVHVKVDLESVRSLKSIYSPSHSVEVRRRDSHNATATYRETDVRPETDFALYFAPEKDGVAVNVLTYPTGPDKGFFLLLASPGVDLPERKVSQRDIVFVLDTSGSMSGRKIQQAKKALRFCVDNLNERDHFEIIRFSTEVEPLFDGLVPADSAHQQKALEFVADLHATGGTAIDEALKVALHLRPTRIRVQEESTDELARPVHRIESGNQRPFVVIFLTDGMPTVGTTDNEQILSSVRNQSKGQARIFCFGIGGDVNTHLLDKISEETRAFAQYVLPEEDIEVKVSNFYSKIKEPVLTNPRIYFADPVHVSQMYPSPLQDIFKGEQIVLAGKYSGSGKTTITLEGEAEGNDQRIRFEADFHANHKANDFIPRLWATRRVGYLLDQIRLHGENGELRDEVTQLSRKYGIVTPYTAYLILEDEQRRGIPEQAQSLQSFKRDGEAQTEAGQNWYRFKNETSGDKALAGARFGMALKSADNASAALATGGIESTRALGLMSPAPSTPAAVTSARSRLMDYSNQSQFVAGKNFFQNNNVWTDSEIQNEPKSPRAQIKFGSPEYFKLTSNPKVLPWLSLGQEVQFLHEGTIYEIKR